MNNYKKNNILISTFKKYNTNRNYFVSGAAGTGKTYVLREFINWIKSEHKEGRLLNVEVIILAPTGLAANSINGQTLASFFGTKTANSINEFDLSKSQLNIDFDKTIFLAIDEVSMISGSYFYLMNEILRVSYKRYIRRKFKKTKEEMENIESPIFGGVKFIFLGDFSQLPPINKAMGPKEKDWIFNSPFWKRLNMQNIILTENRRQVNEEMKNNLWNLRQIKNARAIDFFVSMSRDHKNKDDENMIRLFARNREVDEFNKKKMKQLEGNEYIFKADEKIYENFGTSDDLKQLWSDVQVKKEIILKNKARIMLLKNGTYALYNKEDDKEIKQIELNNGALGHIISIEENYIKIEIDNYLNSYIKIEKALWIKERKYNYKKKNEEFLKTLGEEEEGKWKMVRLAEIKQYPLKIAYAITVHKSQGLTFEHAYIDFSYFFEVNHAYVALSRIRNFDKSIIKNAEVHHFKSDELVRWYYEDLINENVDMITEDSFSEAKNILL